MDEAQVRAAMAAFREFAQAMHLWETAFHQEYMDHFHDPKLAAIKEKGENTLTMIFARHCIPGKTNWGRVESLHSQWPCRYDLTRDELSLRAVKKDAVVLCWRQQTTTVDEYLFTMKMDNGLWKIAKAQYMDSHRRKAITISP